MILKKNDKVMLKTGKIVKIESISDGLIFISLNKFDVFSRRIKLEDVENLFNEKNYPEHFL